MAETLMRFEPYKAKKGEEYMNAKQLAHFRKMLEAWKAELSQDIDTTLHIYDPLASNLTWLGFVGDAPDTLNYADGAVSGTVTLSAMTPHTVAFAVSPNVPQGSFVSEYAQVSNTAYYAFPDETLMLAHPSNTQINIVRMCPSVHLPLVLRDG